MPTIARIGPFRFFFYANEGSEPPHVHVQRDKALAKVWLAPVEIASSTGFTAKDLRTLLRLVDKETHRFVEAWHEFFAKSV